MTSSADLGGMAGFGPVIPEPNEPNFHAEWEARVLGVIVALGACGQWNLDQSRSARETIPPGRYLNLSYYEIWLEAAIKLMRARGMVTDEELAEGTALVEPIPVKGKLTRDGVAAALKKGGPVDRPATSDPMFAVGQTIRTINDYPETHTRLPRYARDKVGTIAKVHGTHVYPDSNAQGLGEAPTWLYKVAFDAGALWGSRARAGDVVTLDLWEPYLRADT